MRKLLGSEQNAKYKLQNDAKNLGGGCKELLVARQYLSSVVFDSAVDGATMHLLCVAPIYRA